MPLKKDLSKDDIRFRDICSRRTLYTPHDGFFNEFVAVMKSLVGTKWIDTVFKDIDNDEDRLRAIYTNDKSKEYFYEKLSYVNTYSKDKDPITAKMKRMDAIQFILKGQYETALSNINMSIVRAPANLEWEAVDYGSSLLLGYMKRSEIFICMGDYKNAFEDLCLAEETNDVPPKMRDIIRFKKADLKRRIEGKETFSIELPSPPIIVPHYPRMISKWEVPQITCGNNPQLINASAKLDIRETEHAGKEIYAKAEIVPGEVLLIEEPLVSLLLYPFLGTHCTECLKRIYAPVACPNCTSVVFCNRKCRDIALSTYHKYECKIHLFVMGSGMTYCSMLVLRSITQEGLDNCLKIYDAINKNKNDNDDEENEQKLSRSARRRRRLKKKFTETSETSGTSNLNDNLASMSLKEKESPIDTTLYELVNHSSERESYDFFERTLMATLILKCLQRINFFRTTSADNEVPNDDEIKVASLILKNLQSFQFHGVMIYDSVYRGDGLNNRSSDNIALAIYPTLSRFNHDCIPMLGRYNIGKKVVVRALKTFQPGDSIPDNYGPSIEENDYTERQKVLMGRFWFKCTCKACDDKWPVAKNFTNAMARLKCPTKGCYKSYTIHQITDKPIFCNLCRRKVDMYEVMNLLYACELKYEEALTLIEEKKILQTVEFMSQVLYEFYKIAIPPHSLTHAVQMMLKSLYCYFGNSYRLPIIEKDKLHSKDSNTKLKSVLKTKNTPQMSV
ncbi:SET and MYND domain-containing protein 4-like [Polistes fuscatus]|uniref:SET and MYND domain-containing protein 4-like n=1 Tax=Polistes fuscatus TaxID=30207 RepID=UPI001CA9F28C|nr:SET and MYND domain-containing protein 4-like [Polistes fuscatus]